MHCGDRQRRSQLFTCDGRQICDFGSAYRADELSSLASTQYIVARYYRAPEIVLGYAAKSAAMDIWSIGVTLIEMYTSKLLFTGR